ncbi:MAG: AAA family ATPase [Elusimicrobia bacterium]|nr:AAA family ATPase [Elusimicrobiota bacterium]
MLARLAKKGSKRLFFWSVTQGIVESGGGNAGDSTVRDPKIALDFAAKVEEPSIFVFKDFHSYLRDDKIVRSLRDLVGSFKSSYKTLVILSPRLTIPMELEKDLTVVDYDLPGPEELKGMFDQVVAASQSGARFPVDFKPGEVERLIQSIQGLTLDEAESTLARAVVQNGKLDASAIEVILKEIKQIVRKSRLLEYFEAKEEIAGIGGLVPLKDWLHKRGRAFSEQAHQFGLPQPRGVLILGVQGCGKSLTCKAIAGLWKLPLLRLDMGSIFGSLVGESEENMRRAIKTAEAVAPCVLWLDELEKGLSGTGSSNMSDGGTTARVFSTFLTWLQEKTKPVFVAATANDISQLPPELLRKGRFDEIFFVDLPGATEREQIFAIHIAKRRRDPKAFDLAALAKLSAGFSGAEIEQAISEALSEAFNLNRDIAQPDLAKALGETVSLSKTMREDIDRLRQWAATRARPASIAGG